MKSAHVRPANGRTGVEHGVIPRRPCHPLVLGAALLAGCESTHQHLIAEGYPPAFADGFSDGCSSGRQAAGVITGAFRKDVPRYLKERTYAEGWGDGFEQCKEQVRSEELREFHEQISRTATRTGSVTSAGPWIVP